jgi:hypothetical protein
VAASGRHAADNEDWALAVMRRSRQTRAPMGLAVLLLNKLF